MTSIKKKPKPFSAMSKVLCTGVQCRRFMVLLSLTLVLLGCFALYSAMQNEGWTTDEPSQRRVFFLAFLLLITSTGLCYYALQGDLEEDKEKMESEKLTSVKHSDYSSIKPNSILSPASRPTVDKNHQDKFILLLEPMNETGLCQKSLQPSCDKSKINCHSKKRSKSPIIYNVDELSNRNCRTQSNQVGSTDISFERDIDVIKDTDKLDSSENNQKVKAESLLVQLMPLLPLQLAEKEMARINSIQNNDSKTLASRSDTTVRRSDTSRSDTTVPNKRTQSDIPCAFAPNHNNADAG